jgi:hypothetical protein
MAAPATDTFGTVLPPTDFIVGRMLGFPLMQRSFAAIALQTADCAQDESPLPPAVIQTKDLHFAQVFPLRFLLEHTPFKGAENAGRQGLERLLMMYR